MVRHMRVLQEKIKGVKLAFIFFVVVLFSVTATFAVNTVVSYETQKSLLTSNTLDSNQITATELSQTTQTILLSMQDTLKSAADYISNGQMSPKSTQAQIDFLRTSVPYFNSVILVNSSGVVTVTSPEALGVIGTKLTSAPVREALAEKKPLISNPYTSVTNRLIVLATYPVFDSDGHYAGFIGGTIYLQESNVFHKLLGEQRSYANGSYYFVVDSAGDLIFHPNASRIGDNVASNPAVKELLMGQSGKIKLTNTLGKHFLSGYASVPAAGWGIVFQTPSSSVEANVGHMISRMSIISAPLLMVVLLLAVFVSRGAAAPINRLAYAAARLKRGDATVQDLPQAKSVIHEARMLYDAVSDAFRMLDRKVEDYSLQARTDVLTGLTNRRRMDAIVEGWVTQRVPFSVIMIDIDHFKRVNDTFGHQVGDEALRFVAQIMLEEKGERDHCCRYGGEEFTILVPLSSAERVYEMAERIRKRSESEKSPTGEPLTLSLGISEFPGAASEAETLFKQADDALYQAKQSGRNRTAVYRAEGETITI